MKKIITAAFISLTITGYAQRAQVQSAYSYLKYEQLDKAKESIDLAVNNENTMNYDKAWYYRGLIYQALYKNEKFSNLSNDPLNEALRSYNKALELNPKFEYADDIAEKKKILAQQFADMGYVNYNLKNFASALTAYEGVVSIMPNDTSSYFNAALCAERAGNTAKAKQYYNKLDEMQYKDPKMYHSYAQLYLTEGDTTKALDILSRGLSRFPEEKSILITQTNIYISSGKTAEALGAINKAIEKDPTNANLYFAIGTLVEKTDKNKDAAVTAYKKAIELKADYFDAYYNLGALYFNDGAHLANEANNIKDNNQYAKAKAVFEAKFKEAKPYLEKAWELNPKDQSTMVSLKQLYATLNDTVNYAKVKAALDAETK
ncbi:MAG TPA: tetratricopeptide repeat protein [Bacteroidia bacterium]|nr:tetratricopeptide repeat protein [Bacteroidia bacterium]HMU18310.1 tetratricopeptide repeat protein [Bacteroidia bacterium]